MAPYYIWFALAAVLVIAELGLGTFYLLMVALGAAAGGLGALAGLGAAAQTLLAALVALAGFVALRRSRYGRVRRDAAERDPNVNPDIGQELEVPAWGDAGRARVRYRGTDWDVELQAAGPAAPGRFRIVEVRGNTLFVSPR
ncbi:NfeD family protein [Cupriavidus basilensis]|uniref:NfeD family protein n=1 Tax=Cupriavidus basilensis TaxID=68895 RepID=A0A643G343_9BURK|nr:NfeD family protein [Cupriavidus basilensis]MCP3018652.1 NfeD family protein [Cupriavidus basilensis]MDR3379671.1 NfeD family protein [Cupriavidus basilensis]QOT78351.1 NfeD family protein [Cupriavidus basilensis]